MNGLFGGFGRGVGGYQMPMNIQAPQQNLSAYYSKPMISQQQYGDFLRNERPMRFITDFVVPAIQGDQNKLQYFNAKAGNTTS